MFHFIGKVRNALRARLGRRLVRAAAEPQSRARPLHPVAPPAAAAIADAAIAQAKARAMAVELTDHAEEFWSIGDVVLRTQDGRQMTIMDFRQTQSDVLIVCAWFEGTRLRVAEFPDGVLETIEGRVPLRRVSLVDLVTWPENFFSPGDRVRIASGGPELIVRFVRSGRSGKLVVCTWLNGTKIESAEFDPQMFKEIDLAR